jgi:RNAse (barnase) inhibitor barstar
MTSEMRGESAAYRLILDEAGTELLRAADIDGFFVDPSVEAPSQVRMVGTTYSRPLDPQNDPRQTYFHDVELQVIDPQGESIGAYYIGGAQIIEVRPSERIGADVDISFFGFTYPFPYAGKIWRRWRQGRPSTEGEWRRLPVEWHDSWLHVVQTAWFDIGKEATRYNPTDRYVVDGAHAADIAGFYCALGEAINGPGGYFGANIAGMIDCLVFATATEPPFELVWRNVGHSEETLGRAEVDAIIAAFHEFSSPDLPGYVTLVLER